MTPTNLLKHHVRMLEDGITPNQALDVSAENHEYKLDNGWYRQQLLNAVKKARRRFRDGDFNEVSEKDVKRGLKPNNDVICMSCQRTKCPLHPSKNEERATRRLR